jgi:hypothetical protein
MKASLVHAYEFRQRISSLSLLVSFPFSFEIGRARKALLSTKLLVFLSKKKLILSIGQTVTQTKRQIHMHVLGRYRMIAAAMTAREREMSERERQRERERE